MEINSREFLKQDRFIKHYYGDTIRALFLIGAVVMLIALPFTTPLLPYPIYFSIAVILILGFLAGMTNPLQPFTAFINVLASTLGSIAFEYTAIQSLSAQSALAFIFFFINQILAIVFFIALYYSVKTLRGPLIKEK